MTAVRLRMAVEKSWNQICQGFSSSHSFLANIPIHPTKSQQFTGTRYPSLQQLLFSSKHLLSLHQVTVFYRNDGCLLAQDVHTETAFTFDRPPTMCLFAISSFSMTLTNVETMALVNDLNFKLLLLPASFRIYICVWLLSFDTAHVLKQCDDRPAWPVIPSLSGTTIIRIEARIVAYIHSMQGNEVRMPLSYR